VCFALGLIAVLLAPAAAAQGIPVPKLPGVTNAKNPQDVANTLVLLFLLTVLSLAPAILILMTPFLRISIVLSLLRQAIGTPQIPANQVIIGLSLFLTFSIMTPQMNEINAKAVQPYLAGKLPFPKAVDEAAKPMRRFMIKQTYKSDLNFFIAQAKLPAEGTKQAVAQDRLPMTVVVPAFVISELKTAFLMGFFIYVPFLIIDLVVSSLLMSMGMMMLPPTVISLPAKLLLFVLADGWHLIIGSLTASFRG
jgi:flagellar biosynthetic protein FliP